MSTHNMPLSDDHTILSQYNNVCSYGIFSLGTQERVRNSRGKRAIGIRAVEVLLYTVLTVYAHMNIPSCWNITHITYGNRKKKNGTPHALNSIPKLILVSLALQNKGLEHTSILAHFLSRSFEDWLSIFISLVYLSLW